MSDFLGLLKFPQTIKTDWQRQYFLKAFNALEVSLENPFTIILKMGEAKRSEAMNRLSHMWYSEVAT